MEIKFDVDQIIMNKYKLIDRNTEFVFIDLKNHYGIKKKILRLVKESLFYFDSTDKFFFIKLKNFLNLPLKKIYDKWERKKLKREELIKNFFSMNTNTAGKEACKKILEYNNLS